MKEDHRPPVEIRDPAIDQQAFLRLARDRAANRVPLPDSPTWSGPDPELRDLVARFGHVEPAYPGLGGRLAVLRHRIARKLTWNQIQQQRDILWRLVLCLEEVSEALQQERALTRRLQQDLQGLKEADAAQPSSAVPPGYDLLNP